MATPDSVSSNDGSAPAHVPANRIVDFDYIADPQMAVDPHAAYLRLRDGPSLLYSIRHGGHWIVTRQEVMAEIFHDSETFSNYPRVIPRSISGLGGKPQPFSDIDPPDNMKYRLLLQQVLNPRAVQAFEAEAREAMIDLVEEVLPRGECEFSSEIAQRLPVNIFMRWTDLPFEDRFRLMDWVDTIMGDVEPERRRAAKDAILNYVDGIVDRRQAHPGDDVISHLVNGEVDGRPVTREEGRAMVANLVNGGLDTVRNMMGFIALFLAQSAGHRRELAQQPALIPAAIEELLRWAAIPNMSRCVKVDTVVDGVSLKAGDMVLMPLVLAGRDDHAYQNAMGVDFHRERLRHLAFGTGAHLCPGMHLARIELRVFLEEWLKRIPEFGIAPGRTPRTRGGIILAVRELPLTWDPN
jgi:cytochrome P450